MRTNTITIIIRDMPPLVPAIVIIMSLFPRDTMASCESIEIVFSCIPGTEIRDAII